MTHFNQGFTVTGSTLKLLNQGEQGIVTRIGSTDETIVLRLQAMGIKPGLPITLEQHSPTCMVRVGNDRLALCEATIHAIYVRVADRNPSLPRNRKTQLFRKAPLTKDDPTATMEPKKSVQPLYWVGFSNRLHPRTGGTLIRILRGLLGRSMAPSQPQSSRPMT